MQKSYYLINYFFVIPLFLCVFGFLCFGYGCSKGNGASKTTGDEFNYTIVFDANGGEGTMDSQEIECSSTSPSTSLIANTFTRAGYEFVNWNLAADGSGQSFEDKQQVRNLTTEDNAEIVLYAQWKNIMTFDENDVVLKFGVISDCHVSVTKKGVEGNVDQFDNALSRLASMGMQAVIINGDFIAAGSTTSNIEKEVETFTNIIKKYQYSTFGSNVILTAGNHDTRSELSLMPNLRTILGDDYFKDIDYEEITVNGKTIAFRHWLICGYHFICVEPNSYGSGSDPIDSHFLAKLDSTLRDITEENPDQYVFFATHPTIKDTAYGSYDDQEIGHERWRNANLVPILSKYPQVVAFSGHTHGTIADERCIMQTSFTTINDGSTSSASVEIDKYANVQTSSPINSKDESSGLAIEIDRHGNVRVNRINFKIGDCFKQAWELSYPNSPGFLDKYSKATRLNNNEAPQLPLDSELDCEPKTNTPLTVTLSSLAFSDDDFVHHYKIIVEEIDSDGALTKVNELLVLSDYYLYSNPKMQMSNAFSFELTLPTAGNYKISLIAVDSWDFESPALFTTINLNSQ